MHSVFLPWSQFYGISGNWLIALGTKNILHRLFLWRKHAFLLLQKYALCIAVYVFGISTVKTWLSVITYCLRVHVLYLCTCSKQVFEKKPLRIKNFGVWLRYDSRSGTHNMYREYRDLTVAGAVTSCCKFENWNITGLSLSFESHVALVFTC